MFIEFPFKSAIRAHNMATYYFLYLSSQLVRNHIPDKVSTYIESTERHHTFSCKVVCSFARVLFVLAFWCSVDFYNVEFPDVMYMSEPYLSYLYNENCQEMYAQNISYLRSH